MSASQKGLFLLKQSKGCEPIPLQGIFVVAPNLLLDSFRAVMLLWLTAVPFIMNPGMEPGFAFAFISYNMGVAEVTTRT